MAGNFWGNLHLCLKNSKVVRNAVRNRSGYLGQMGLLTLNSNHINQTGHILGKRLEKQGGGKIMCSKIRARTGITDNTDNSSSLQG